MSLTLYLIAVSGILLSLVAEKSDIIIMKKNLKLDTTNNILM